MAGQIWKNDLIIAISIHAGANSFLLNAIDCDANSSTAEYYVKITSDSIEYCKNIFKVEIFAFVLILKIKWSKQVASYRKKIII